MVFQPFSISQIEYYKPLFVLGYFAVTLIVMLIGFIVAPYLFPKYFNPDTWTLLKNILLITFQIILIAILNWAYSVFVGAEHIPQHNFFKFIFITFSVGIIPVLLAFQFIERKLSKINQGIAQDFSSKLQERGKAINSQMVMIESENKNESMKIELDDLICIKSEANYAMVYIKNENKTKSKLVRNSISKIASQLGPFNSIERCHRSYIVNFDAVETVSGNARNLNLHIPALDFTIPVSRDFPREIISRLKNNN